MSFKDKPASLQIKLERRREIDLETGCWLWTGTRNNRGHGTIRWGKGKQSSVSRVAMHVYKGFDLDSPEVICHVRTCPNSHCFNPEHLYVGTPKENTADSVALKTHYLWGRRKG